MVSDLPHGIPGEDVQPQRIVRNSFVSPRWCALALALTAARGSNTLSHLIKTLAVPVHCEPRGDTNYCSVLSSKDAIAAATATNNYECRL